MAKNFVSNKDETARIFDNNFLEALSRVHFSIPVIIYLPIVGYLLYSSFAVHQFSIQKVVFYFFFGVFVWTITEYVLHRFVFHFEPKSEFGKRIHFIFHGVHHDYPSDSKRLVMPPSVSIPLAVLFYFLFKWMLGVANVTPFFAGFLIGYLFYDMTHYAIHHFNMHSKFWLKIKNHHMKHHFQDSSKGYGVSTPIWDLIIRTDFPEKTKK